VFSIECCSGGGDGGEGGGGDSGDYGCVGGDQQTGCHQNW